MSEVIATSTTVPLILVLIRRSVQAWQVLGLSELGARASTGYHLWVALRKTAIHRANFSDAIAMLRMGLTMFVFRSPVALYTSANAFIFSHFVEPRVVGLYAGAARIAKSLFYVH